MAVGLGVYLFHGRLRRVGLRNLDIAFPGKNRKEKKKAEGEFNHSLSALITFRIKNHSAFLLKIMWHRRHKSYQESCQRYVTETVAINVFFSTIEKVKPIQSVSWLTKSCGERR